MLNEPLPNALLTLIRHLNWRTRLYIPHISFEVSQLHVRSWLFCVFLKYELLWCTDTSGENAADSPCFAWIFHWDPRVHQLHLNKRGLYWKLYFTNGRIQTLHNKILITESWITSVHNLMIRRFGFEKEIFWPHFFYFVVYTRFLMKRYLGQWNRKLSFKSCMELKNKVFLAMQWMFSMFSKR